MATYVIRNRQTAGGQTGSGSSQSGSSQPGDAPQPEPGTVELIGGFLNTSYGEILTTVVATAALTLSIVNFINNKKM
jgi:hypothetical protein